MRLLAAEDECALLAPAVPILLKSARGLASAYGGAYNKENAVQGRLNEVDRMEPYAEINAQANTALDELFAAADTLRAGDIFVVGCSTSEVMGKMIGTGSNVDAAKAIMDAVLPRVRNGGCSSPRNAAST